MMMYRKLTVLLLVLMSLACKNDAKQGQEVNQEFKDEHNAKTSLDYVGVYEGELPCADCEQILYKISINEDMTFYSKYIYQGKSKEVFVEKGNYYWSENGNVITLKSKKQTTQFKVRENNLLMLSQGGKEIESAFQEKYVLHKS